MQSSATTTFANRITREMVDTSLRDFKLRSHAVGLENQRGESLDDY